jgi:predicted protein tyrosine phosphatase
VSDSRLNVLFVCAMNKQRSVTAERLYRNEARLEVRSAGVRAEAKRRINEADLKWADVVFVMERESLDLDAVSRDGPPDHRCARYSR